MPKTVAKTEIVEVKIPAPKFKTMTVTIWGVTPLLCNRNSGQDQPGWVPPKNYKSKTERLTQKKANPGKAAEEEFLASLYTVSSKKGQYFFPTGAIRKSMIGACRSVKEIKMTEASQYFQVLPEPGCEEYVKISAKKPEMLSKSVRVGKGGCQVRHRAIFKEWSITFRLKFNEEVISEQAVMNLLNTAGFAVGIGDWRPEKGGTMGMFELVGKKGKAYA